MEKFFSAIIITLVMIWGTEIAIAEAQTPHQPHPSMQANVASAHTMP